MAAMSIEQYKKKFIDTQEALQEFENKVKDLAETMGVSPTVFKIHSGGKTERMYEERAEALTEMGLMRPDEILGTKRKPKQTSMAPTGQPKKKSK